MRKLKRILATTLILAAATTFCVGGISSSSGGTAWAISNQLREMCQQAEQLLNSGKFKEAMNILNKANSIDPNCAEVHGYLGMAHQNSGSPMQAIPEYQKALQLSPSMSFINVNLGTCLMNANRLQEAVPYFQKYLQENPNAPDAGRVRGYLQQVGTRGNQQNLRGLVEQGQMMLQQQRPNEARALFEQAVAAQPDFAPAHFFLGYSLGQTGQHQQAIAHFQQALRLDPNMKEASMNIASNYQSLGDIPNAITWYDTYLKQNPPAAKAAEVRQRVDGLRRQASQAQGSGGPSSQLDYLGQVASGGKYFRWRHAPIAVCIAPGAGVPGYQESFRQQLMDAFTMWQQATNGGLTFTLVQNPSQANIYCDWTGDPRKIMEAGRAVEGGLTKLSGTPEADGNVAISNVRMTLLTNRGGAPLNDMAMKRVCLHEVGHALGLSGHSSVNSDIMFYSETIGGAPVLSQRDIATIHRLYGSSATAGGR